MSTWEYIRTTFFIACIAFTCWALLVAFGDHIPMWMLMAAGTNP